MQKRFAIHGCILASACGAILTATARADWSLTTVDGTAPQKLTINTWDATEGLSATNRSGSLVKIPTRDVVTLSSGKEPASEETPGTWRLKLRDGDLLLGQPAGMSGQSLRYTVPELGTIAVPIKDVFSLAHGKPGTQPAAGSDKDVVHFGNGDTMQGVVADVQADKLQLATGAETGNATTTHVAINLVDSIVFAGAMPPRRVPPLSARVTFKSGTVLTVPLDGKTGHFSWTINVVTLADPGGESHRVPAEQLASIDVVGGRMVSLTELDPASDEQVSFLGTSWPTAINKNVMGGPLMVGKTTAHRGLGVHTRSAIAYDLDGTFDTLKLRVGMDDSAWPRGAADVSVVLDGQVLWHHEVLRAGLDAPPEVLDLSIKGGKHLELHADPPKDAAGLDVLGRVDWLSPTLVRP